MRPTPVTYIKGQLTPGSGDWRGQTNLQVQLRPADGRAAGQFALGIGGGVNLTNGTFEFRQVFPGSYRLILYSQRNFVPGTDQQDSSDQVGANVKLEVAEKPIEVSLPVNRAVDVSGTVEMERASNATNSITLSQLSLQLTAENQFGGPPPPAKVNNDGTFTFKSVLPGEWRIRTFQRGAFLKSAWLGGDDVTNKVMDLTSGAAAPLRIVVSTNTATIRGTAPPGQMVYYFDEARMQGFNASQSDQSGQFNLQGLAPGKYRLVVADIGMPMPDEGGQIVEVHEGETVMVELKAGGRQ
jgi:hypothetical protein